MTGYMVNNHGLLMGLLMINGGKMGLSMVIWLVVWNMFVHSVGNVIIPTDGLFFFQRGRYTTNQMQ